MNSFFCVISKFCKTFLNIFGHVVFLLDVSLEVKLLDYLRFHLVLMLSGQFSYKPRNVSRGGGSRVESTTDNLLLFSVVL